MAGSIRTVLFTILVPLPCPSLGQTTAPPGRVPIHDNWFDHPEILCRALECQGLPAGRWRPLAPDSSVYQCEYPPYPGEDPSRQPVTADRTKEAPRTSVFFQVSAKYPNQADRIALRITINAPDAIEEAKLQMLGSIRAVYHVIGQNLPSALAAYVGQEQHYLPRQPYGVVSFFAEYRRDRRPEQLLWFRLGKNP